MKKHLIKENGFKSIYKGVPPFMRFEKGYGYYGVLLEKEDDGKLQCHLCGHTALNLAKHIHHKHKDMTPRQYRELTGLSLTTPLISEKTRKKIKNNFLNLTKEEQAAAIKRLQANNKKGHQKKNRGRRTSKASLETNNKYGTCPAQVRALFWETYNNLGRLPKWLELPGKLRYIIEDRFGSYEEAVVVWGVSRKEYRQHITNGKVAAVEARRDHDFFPKYTKEEVRKKYLAFAKLRGRLPTWGEVAQLGLPSRQVFEKAFGCTKSQLEASILTK